ncbi:MAG: HAD family hydrolase [Candidatus Lokiarchaeota archaeon]
MYFDLNGTLLKFDSSSEAWNDWLHALYDELHKIGLKLEINEFSLNYDKFFDNLNITKNENCTLYESKIKVLLQKLNLNSKPNEIVRKIANKTVNAWGNHLYIQESTIETLLFLKKSMKICLISNYDHPPFVYNMVNRFGLQDIFDKIFISGEVGFKKPDPQIFNIALKYFNFKPKEVRYVGDSIEDYKGAINSGIKPIIIEDNTILQQISASNFDTIKEVSELPGLLNLI